MSGKYIYIYVYRYHIYIFTSIYLNYHICGFLLIINDFFGSYGEEFFLKFWILARLRWRFGCLPTTKEGKASRGAVVGGKTRDHTYICIYIYTYMLCQESFLFWIQFGELFDHIWKSTDLFWQTAVCNSRNFWKTFSPRVWGRFPNLAKPSLQLATKNTRFLIVNLPLSTVPWVSRLYQL